MNQNVHFRLVDNNDQDIVIHDLQTGTMHRPFCGKIFAAYYRHLVECGRINEAQALLAECVAGVDGQDGDLQPVYASKAISGMT